MPRRSRFPLIKARAIAAMKPQRFAHRLNPRAVRHELSLGDAVGMSDMGIHLVRIRPGAETTEYHTHYCDEEFLYILSGRGIADIGGRKVEVGAGDFMGFPAQAPAHTMANPFEADLVYLMGGTRKPFDVSEYPRRRLRAYKFAGLRDTVRFQHVKRR